MNSVSTTENALKKGFGDSRRQTLIYFFMFAAILACAILGRMLPRSRRPFAQMTNPGDSVWQEADKTVNVVMGYVNMQ